MWDRCKKYITGGVIGAIVGFLVAFSISTSLLHIPKPIVTTDNKTVEVRLVTKLDTIYQKQYIDRYLLVERPQLIQTDTIKTTENKLVMIPAVKRVYNDSLQLRQDSVSITYKAHTTGSLDKLELNYRNYKAQKTILRTDSVFTTTTITKSPGGLYIGLDAGYNTITPKLEYVKGMNSFSAGYNIISNSPQVGYSRRIF